MKSWMKYVMFAMICALPAAACVSPEDAPPDEEARTDELADPAAAADQLDVEPESAAASCEGEFTCPTTGQDWIFTCGLRNVVWAYRACDAACVPACIRT